MKKTNIIIADSYYLSRKGLCCVLGDNTDFNIIAEAANSSELMALSQKHAPHIVIIDYTSSHFSLDVIPQVLKKLPETRFLAITDIQPNGLIAKSLKNGVTSHLLKECEKDEIIEAVYKTALGENFMCGKITGQLLEEKNNTYDTFSCSGTNVSDRELEIITLVAEGYSNKEIADKLFLSTHTVTTHRKNIMNKLGINNTAGLVLFAVRENLISPNHFLFSSNN